MSWRSNGQQNKASNAGSSADSEEDRRRQSPWLSQPSQTQPCSQQQQQQQQQQPLKWRQQNHQQQVQCEWVTQTEPREYQPTVLGQHPSPQQNHLQRTQSRQPQQTDQQDQPLEHQHCEGSVTASAAVRQQLTSPAPARVQPHTNGVYVPPWRARKAKQEQLAACANLKEYTVQLVPDLFSIQLVGSSPAAFQGLTPPRHHNITPIHAFLQEVCEDSGASFADVWPDTAHITFATLALPAGREQEFAALLSAAAGSLPELTTGCYKIVGLQHYDKRTRRDAAIKGSNFYYLDLDSTTEDFVRTQSVWLEALTTVAQQVGGSCTNIRSIEHQHMTVRSFSLRDATKSFQRIRKAVQAQPATMKCAGIRIQQSVDQALEAGSDQGIVAHGYFYQPQARYPVCLYSSCMQASYHVRLKDELMRHKQKADEAAQNAVVKQMLDQLELVCR